MMKVKLKISLQIQGGGMLSPCEVDEVNHLFRSRSLIIKYKGEKHVRFSSQTSYIGIIYSFYRSSTKEFSGAFISLLMNSIKMLRSALIYFSFNSV